MPMVKKLEIPNKLQGTLPDDIDEAVNLNPEEVRSTKLTVAFSQSSYTLLTYRVVWSQVLHVRAFQAMDRKLFAPLLRIDVPGT